MLRDGCQIDEYEDHGPVDMLAALFEARGWNVDQEGDEELKGVAPGAWTNYEFRAVWRPEDQVLQMLCLPDIRVPAEKRRSAVDLLALVNEQVWLGHFDIWSNGGILVYRHGLLLEDDGLLSVDRAQGAVEAAIAECDRFYPAFQFVLWGDKAPRDALDAALVDAAGEA